MSQFQGRKVTDPKARTTGYSELYGSAVTGLEKAWDTLGNAKSSLRRTEHRLNEATKPALFDLEADMDFTVPVDRIPSYTITDSHASRQDKGLIVDKYGRSQHMKSKMSDNGGPLRKVSRMDDKYSEDQSQFTKPYQYSRDSSSKPYQSSKDSYRKAPDFDLKPVKYTDSGYTKTDYSYGSKFTDMTNLTNSQDIRSTERRFINDNVVSASSKPTSSLSVKMNQVDVPVPSAVRSKSGPKFSDVKSYASSENGPERDVTFTLPSSSGSIGRKVKRGLIKDSDSMEKIREMIRKQRLNLSSSDGGEVSDTGSDKQMSRKLSHHHDDEPVVPRSYDLYHTQDKPAPIRKIAAGPKAPTYSGFNEVVTTVQTPDGNLYRDKHQRKEAKKEKVLAKMQVERQLQADAAKKEHLLKAAKRKEAIAKEAAKLEAEKHAKKQARVVASKRPSKFEGKDLITTTSWRVGANKVKQLLAEDGDMRQRSVSPPVKDKAPTKQAEVKSHKQLSEEAKSVLADMQSDKSDDESEKDSHRPTARSRAPRTRTKSAEQPTKQEKIVKVRSYDKDTARQYIRKQKEERKRKEAQEAEEKRLKEERRKQKLEELNRKRMENLRSRSRSTGAPSDGGSQRGGKVSQQTRSKAGSGSDKENKRFSEESDSATITDGASEGENTHQSISKPIKTEQLIDKYSNKPQSLPPKSDKNDKGIEKKDLINKYLVLQQTGMTSDEIVMKFQQSQALKEVRKPEPYDPSSSLPTRDAEPIPASRPYTAPSSNVVDNKTARVQAILASGSRLRNKIQQSAQEIHHQPTDKWAMAPEEAGYVSRYSRITGANQDYSVFTGSQLPGVGNVGRKAHDKEQTETNEQAATKIQAAYRGSTVRQAVAPYLYSKPDKVEDSDHSMLSDDTITEDSDVDMHMEPSAKIPIKLSKTEYCHGGGEQLADAPIDLLKPTKPMYRWDPPKADPYSILNVYDRKAAQARSGNLRSRGLDYKGYDTSENYTQSNSTVERSRSPHSASYEDDFTKASSTKHSLTEPHARSPRSRSYKSSKAKSPQRSRRDTNEDDTLEDDSLPISAVSDEDRQPSKKETSLSLVRSSRGDMLDGAEGDSDLSRVSSLTEEDSELSDPLKPADPVKQPLTNAKPFTTGYGVPKMSPAALEQRLHLEINLLGGVDESLRQLTDVERTRAVSLAQQESVSLAQILKARQQAQSREMADLQTKAKQEKFESALQLEEARRRASEATEMASHTLAQVRADSASSLQDSTKKLIETQSQAAKATAEAARQLAEHMGLPVTQETHATQYSRQSVYSTADGASSRADRTDISQSYNSDSFTSDSYTRTEMKTVSSRKQKDKSATSDIKTESQARGPSTAHTASIATEISASKDISDSIRTESGAAGPLSPKTDSIQEDFSEKDYSMSFETSMTEDDIEKSLREVLPSESQRKKLKKDTSHSELDEFMIPDTEVNPRRLSFEEASFTKFSTEMVKSYMREEEIRSQHQTALLKLRERALKEKTQAELAWLEQKKKHVRDKGADDAYPQIKKRQRGLILRLQQEQAEIRRLHEAHRAASKERLLMLQQSKEISRLRKSAQEVREKLKRTCSGGSVGDLPSAVQSGDELSLHFEDQTEDVSVVLDSPRKDSESEARPASPGDKQVIDKIKKMKVDPKFLTAREQKLRERRLKVEEYLEWKKKLDEEEMEIKNLEKEAMRWKAAKKEKEPSVKSKDKSKPPVTPRTPRTPRTETSIATEFDAESIATEKESPRGKGGKSMVSFTEDIQTEISTKRQLSDSSIQEEFSKTQDSGDDTITNSSVNEDYTNETFESAEPSTTQTASKAVTATSPRQNRSKSAKDSKKSPKKSQPNGSYRKGSESESDDSYSLPPSEGESNASDIENRIKTLNEEMKKKKLEADKLKAEKKKKSKEELRKKEENIKKQIKEYDTFISQTKTELALEDESNVKPQIKKPKAKKQDEPETKPQQQKITSQSEPSKFKTSQSESSSKDLTTPNDDVDSSRSASPSLSIEAPASEHSDEHSDDILTSLDAALPSTVASDSPKKDLLQISTSSPNKESIHTAQVDSVFESAHIESAQIDSEVQAELSPLDGDLERDVDASSLNAGTVVEKPEEPKSSTKSKSLSSIKEDISSKTTTTTSESIKSKSEDFKVDTSVPPKTELPKEKEMVQTKTPREISETITEDIPEDVYTGFSTDNEKSGVKFDLQKSDLKLDLGELNREAENKQEPQTPVSARGDTKPQDTARSISEIPEESLIQTARTETEIDTPRSERDEPATDRSEKSRSHRATLSARSGKSDYSEDYELEDKSDRSQSYTYSSSRTSKYSDDFSSSESVTPTEKSEPAPPEKSKSEPKKVSSAEKITPKEDSIIEESIQTADDITENLSVESEDEVSGIQFDLHAEVKCEDKQEELEQTFSDDLQINDRVLVGGVKPGTLLFKGKTQFASGMWGGVELDQPEGTNNGSKDGVEYFKCKSGHGIFAPPDRLSPLARSEDPKFSEVKLSQDPSEPGEDSLLESELENVISAAEAAVAEFEDKEKEEIKETPKEEEKTTDSDSRVEVAAQNLMNEAITQMLNIHTNKTQKLSKSAEQENKKEHDLFDDLEKEKDALDDDILEILDTPRDKSTKDDLKLDLGPPVKTTDDLDDLYKELENYHHDEDGFIDDDDLLSSPRQKVTSFSSDGELGPGGVSKDELKLDLTQDLKLDLQKLSEEIMYIVPHKREDIEPIIDNTIDVYWEKRRYGESWDDVEIPDTFYSSEDNASDLDGRSKRDFKRLLFEMCGELLVDMYKEEDDTVTPIGQKVTTSRSRFVKEKSPPTTCTELKPIVRDHVLRGIGIETESGTDIKSTSKWGSRKKKDHVDQILIAELRQEEPSWVNYDNDELSVKNQLADSIFDSLLIETGQIMSGILAKNSGSS